MAQPTLLEMKGIRKRFGSITALGGIDFGLQAREIHGLLGGNGAGKTTLMNILYGLYRADEGEIWLQGKRVDIHSPKDAIRHGIGMVHQHFLQVGTFTVVQDVVLGMPVKTLPVINLGRVDHAVRKLADDFGLKVDPSAVVEELPVGVRQRVEILKALYRGVDILILDEPTANLTPQEVDSLFASLRAMVDRGMSVVFISHKIREALSICHRISVLRDGGNVSTVESGDTSVEELARAMVGEKLNANRSLVFSLKGRAISHPAKDHDSLLGVDDLRVAGEGGTLAVDGCSFQVRGGEIFGIAGVAGNGQRELAEALVGIRSVKGGRIVLKGREVTGQGVPEMLARGVNYIPEDRHHDGFLPAASIAHNLILGYQRADPYARGWILDWKTIRSSAEEMMSEYDIQASDTGAIAANLSGGNIQRLILARAFAHISMLLIAHNPTRGLDIAFMEFVYSRVLEAKRRGTSMVLLSEDLDELMLLSDRLGVIYEGRILRVVERGHFDRYGIGRLMSGVRT